LPGFIYNKNLRRESSLSVALQKSDERLILLEGEPGSGKSVALRHVAQKMAYSASKSKNPNSLIPIYINLKEIDKALGQEINREFIEKFILKTLNRVNDRDIEEFLEEHFRKGLNEGTWLFLFDSFDEIPEILSSTEADEIINVYAGAIRDFLRCMNNCRGVIASREYRGPSRLGWPRFRILALSKKRCVQLIKKSGLQVKIQFKIINNLAIATPDFQKTARNPMFLGLLCNFLRDNENDPFPQHTHTVFGKYINQRLTRDKNRLDRGFRITPEQILLGAEKLALCMTTDPNLGLCPTRYQLYQATKQLGLGFKEEKEFNTIADALEFLKLARSEMMLMSGDSRQFTFSHRRFQEYFATSIVLRDPTRVTHEELIMNARWRETTVVLLQAQDIDSISSIMQVLFLRLKLLISQMNINLQKDETKIHQREHKKKATNKKIDLAMNYLKGKLSYSLKVRENLIKEAMEGYFNDYKVTLKQPINWPRGLFHILGILQDSSYGKKHIIPKDIKDIIDQTLLYSVVNGTTYDKKWGLEVAGSASDDALIQLIQVGFNSRSQWLNDIAYKQVARLGMVPDSLSKHIHLEIVNMAFEKRLFSNYRETYAHLKRLDSASIYLKTLHLMLLAPIIDHLFVIIGPLLLCWLNPLSMRFGFCIVASIMLLLLRWHCPSHSIRERNAILILSFLASIFVAFSWALIGQRQSVLAVILLFYFVTWGPVAISLSEIGSFTNPLWWIFYPVVPIVILIVAPIIVIISGCLQILLSIKKIPEYLLALPVIIFTFLEVIIRIAFFEIKKIPWWKVASWQKVAFFICQIVSITFLYLFISIFWVSVSLKLRQVPLFGNF